MSDQELFSFVQIDSLETEQITAPRYSYWQSVMRIFFQKKINIAALILLGVVLIFT